MHGHRDDQWMWTIFHFPSVVSITRVSVLERPISFSLQTPFNLDWVMTMAESPAIAWLQVVNGRV
jgi:hypothetical protein